MITISSIIKIENQAKYKLHAARQSGKSQPLDVFVRDRDDWVDWNRWRKPKDEFNRDYIFSLIDFYYETDTWLFGGIFRVIGRGKEIEALSYDIVEVEEYKQYVGCLKIIMKKPARGRAFKLEKHYNKMSVGEILKKVYSGERFPGYENVNLSFKKLNEVITNEKPDWKRALESINGIYCIFDTKTGKKYVGSTYGGNGVWSRWASYHYSGGHGGNIALKELLGDVSSDYAKDNFQISLLELIPLSKDKNYVIDRESHWKRVLLAHGEFGYNRN